MLDKIKECAVDAALAAGEILRDGFGTSFKISSKEGKNNLVTEYDSLAEELIISRINKQFPDHVFLAEESGKTGENIPDTVRWIIDPLDGTVNFAHSLPIFSVSIAAELNNELICGVVYQPILKELFIAVKGKGAYLNDMKLSVSSNGDLDSSILVTGFPYNVNENPCNCIDHFVNFIKRGIPVRRLGSAALDLAYVAAGRFDGFWEIDLNPWDVAAGVLLVKEAGGNVTQYNGQSYWIDDQSILATNGRIHKDVSGILSNCDCGISV